MKSVKTLIAATAVLCAAGFVHAQQTEADKSSDSKSESTVEQEYMQNMDDILISELALSDDYENKQTALAFLQSSIEDGHISPDMMAALTNLSGEGISTKSTTKGRVMNNYPDVRRKACELLGKVKTEEAKKALVNITLTDNEPTVIAAAVHSLGDIGINNKDEVVKAIAWAQKKNYALNPNSSLALEVLVAYEKLVDSVENKSDMIQSITAIAGNGKYNTAVRAKARDMIQKMQGSARSNNSNSSSNENEKK
ncbi:MAG: HEAT repeat domain-containing protein [Treponema sp.]|nr:HEAT repeat domain-containing protein [Treponema sp.]